MSDFITLLFICRFQFVLSGFLTTAKRGVVLQRAREPPPTFISNNTQTSRSNKQNKAEHVGIPSDWRTETAKRHRRGEQSVYFGNELSSSQSQLPAFFIPLPEFYAHSGFIPSSFRLELPDASLAWATHTRCRRPRWDIQHVEWLHLACGSMKHGSASLRRSCKTLSELWGKTSRFQSFFFFIAAAERSAPGAVRHTVGFNNIWKPEYVKSRYVQSPERSAEILQQLPPM